jgi:hypothetical protein
LPDVILPERETRPPAFWAAASAWAMKGLARWEPEERMRPGRMRKSSSPLMAGAPHIASTHGNSCENAEYARPADEAHLAYSLPKPLKIHDRTKPHLAAFYPAIVRSCCLPPTAAPSMMRRATPDRDCGRTPSSRFSRA